MLGNSIHVYLTSIAKNAAAIVASLVANQLWVIPAYSLHQHASKTSIVPNAIIH